MDHEVDSSKVKSSINDCTSAELRTKLVPELFWILALCKSQEVESVLEHFQK